MNYEVEFGTALQERGAIRFSKTIVGSGSTGLVYGVAERFPREETSSWGRPLELREVEIPAGEIRYYVPPIEGFLASVSEDVALFELTRATTTAPDVEKHAFLPSPFDRLSPNAATAVMSQWQVPCEAAFDFLADYFQTDLIRLVSSQALRPVDLTLAAESVGRISTSDLVQKTLDPLLNHPDALVREGAIYGLRGHLNEEIRGRLARIAESDPSEEVRQDAADLLVDW